MEVRARSAVPVRRQLRSARGPRERRERSRLPRIRSLAVARDPLRALADGALYSVGTDGIMGGGGLFTVRRHEPDTGALGWRTATQAGSGGSGHTSMPVVVGVEVMPVSSPVLVVLDDGSVVTGSSGGHPVAPIGVSPQKHQSVALDCKKRMVLTPPNQRSESRTARCDPEGPMLFIAISSIPSPLISAEASSVAFSSRIWCKLALSSTESTIQT